MTNTLKIGLKLKKLRIKLNLSQVRFGAKIGVSGKTISAYENGRCEPTIDIIQRISESYGEVFLHAKSDYSIEIERKIRTIKDYLSDIEKIFG